MKMWISGEIDSIVSDSFRETRNHLERVINENIFFKDYGPGLISWDIIVCISKEGCKELFKFNKRTKETEIRLSIEIKIFQTADLSIKRKILFDALIYSLEKLNTLKIPDFNNEELIKDLLEIETKIIN